MTLPKHPTGEGPAFRFHFTWGVGLGILHILGGIAMVAWHGVAAWRHLRDWKGKE